MQSVTLHRYWQFGTGFRYLQDARTGYTMHGGSFIIGNIESLFQKLDELNLQVTVRAARPLAKLLEEFKATSSDSVLDSTQAKRLNSTIKSLRQTLEAELWGMNAYVVSPKRIATERLVGDPSVLFSPDVFSNLTDIAKYDITEAAKCIAFERPTAAAFHLMRATEESLRNYYCHFIKRDRLDPMLWGPMVQALNKHRKAKVHDALNRNLDNIRISFRNPTQHPDKIYDIHEVQDLWGLCVDVINRMDKIRIQI